MNQFNYRVFLVLTVLLAILTFFAFSVTFSGGTEAPRDSVLHIVCSDFIGIMRFPVHFIFARFFKNPMYFAVGLIINCLIYGAVLERILSFFIGSGKRDDS
jgi:hypothetical protein